MERNNDRIFRHGFNDTPALRFPWWRNNEEYGAGGNLIAEASRLIADRIE
jgi:hypothetical protein